MSGNGGCGETTSTRVDPEQEPRLINIHWGTGEKHETMGKKIKKPPFFNRKIKCCGAKGNYSIYYN